MPRRNRTGKRRQRRRRAKNTNASKCQNEILEPALSTEDVQFQATDEKLFLILGMFDDLAIDESLEKFIVNNDELFDDFFILGLGAFGLVTLGILKQNGQRQQVALKESNHSMYDRLLVNEAKILSELDHPNIIKLMAVQRGPMKIAIEYMELGDVTDALKWAKFTGDELVQVLHDVASGMRYLESKQIIHMDLALRNVFVNSKKESKIGDFGLSKYVGDTHGVCSLKGLHISLCAPEAVTSGKFTSKSDVWSMGLFVWDLYFEATREHLNIKKYFLEMFQLFGCRVLPRSPICPMDLHLYAMAELLNTNPNERPSFSEVLEKIESFIAK